MKLTLSVCVSYFKEIFNQKHDVSGIDDQTISSAGSGIAEIQLIAMEGKRIILEVEATFIPSSKHNVISVHELTEVLKMELDIN